MSSPLLNLHSKQQQFFVLLVFGVFLLWDGYASFEFYRHTAIMGDLTAIAFPVSGYDMVLDDPLGIEVLLTGEAGAGPNRFWAHFTTRTYFDHIPLLLQSLGTPPVDSLYVACALLKLVTQIGLMAILSKWVLGNRSVFTTEGLVVLVFVGSFFLMADTVHRAFDVKRSMIIIDNSIVYTIFYPLSLLFLMVYLHPFLQRIRGFKASHFSILQHLGLFFLSFLVSFNGPLNGPVLLLFCPLLLLVGWTKCYKQAPPSPLPKALVALQGIPRDLLIHLVWVVLLNLYAFYLGTYNIENPSDMPNLAERYALFGQGFYYEYIWNDFHPAPLAILFGLILLNTGFIFKILEKNTRRTYLATLAIILIFITVYTLMLPLGGYRTYRPFVVRYDVGMPNTLSIFFLFFYSSALLLAHFKGKAKLLYAAPLLGLLIFMTIIDRVPNPPSNACEYTCLKQFAHTEKQLVKLPPCPVLSWHLFSGTTGIESVPVAGCLYRWGVIDRPDKRYYNQPYPQ